MTKNIGQPEWATNIKRALSSLEQDERESEQIPQPAYREYAKASHAVARKKYEAELRTYQKALKNGYVVVDTVVNLPFRESAGLRLTKFFNALKTEGKILALHCPECRRTIFPPRAVCGFCRVTAGRNDDDWFALGDRGTVTSIVLPTEREVDRATGRIVGEPNPCAFIRLDGGDEWTVLVHYLERADVETLRRGMRVRAVWKPKAQRRGRLSDIAYFEVMEA